MSEFKVMPCEMCQVRVRRGDLSEQNVKSTSKRKLEKTGHFRRIYMHFVWFKTRISKVELQGRLISLEPKAGSWEDRDLQDSPGTELIVSDGGRRKCRTLRQRSLIVVAVL